MFIKTITLADGSKVEVKASTLERATELINYIPYHHDNGTPARRCFRDGLRCCSTRYSVEG